MIDATVGDYQAATIEKHEAATKIGTVHNVRNLEDQVTAALETCFHQFGRPDPRVAARVALGAIEDFNKGV